MQNVLQETVSDSDKDNSSQNSDSNLNLATDRNCEAYADIEDIYSSSGESAESEIEEAISEVESFVLGDCEGEVGFQELLNQEAHSASFNNQYNGPASFLLRAAHASGGAVSDFCVGECTGVQTLHHHHHHTAPQFDPETQARLVALLEAADPEVLRRLTSSVSSALDEAAAALTRMRTDTAPPGGSLSSAGVTGASTTVGGSSSSSSNSSSSSSSSGSSGENNSCGSSSSSSGAGGGGDGGSCGGRSDRSTSSSSQSSCGGQRSLVEACSDGDVHAVKRLLDEGKSVHETTEEGESLLSLTCSAGYFDLAQVLLAMRANVEDRGVKGDCTPLMEASSAGHVQIVKLLLAHHADVNAQSSSGNTPLMYACGGGHTEVVKVLLDHGANVEDHNENGHTPLMEAASAGFVKVAKLLLERGAGINTSSNEFKESALTLACYKGHLDMVKFLLDAGADQEHKTDEMHTALMEASMDGHVEVARLLLNSGAQVNMPADSFESPLTLAACGGHTDLALLLLERGANIEEVNDEGYTPLMEAAREGHEEMVALLLTHDADINAQTEETQETALTLACCGGFKEVASILLRSGADLELGASTPLMEAAQEGHRDLVRYLIEMGANVNAQTATGDTALTYACENGHTDVAGNLLRANAHLEHKSEGGRTPLMKACRAGHICTVQYLVMKGADVNRSTADNDHTPLSLACVGGHLRIVEFLLANGADSHHKLKDNSTMLMEASKGGHTLVVKLLMDYPNSLTLSTSGSSDVSVESAPPQSMGNQPGGSQHLSMGLTVVPGPGQEGCQLALPVGASASAAASVVPTGQAPLSDVGDDSICSSKNARTTPKGSKKNANFSAEALCEAQNLMKEDFQLDDKSRGPAKFLDALKREVEHAHYTREEQILSKQLILDQLHRAEKHIGAVGGSGGCLRSLIAEAGSLMNSSNSSSMLNTAINNQVMYSNGSLPNVLPQCTQTAETQTSYLPSPAWTVVPSGVGISDISPSLKSNQLPPTVYNSSSSGAASQQTPVAFGPSENLLDVASQDSLSGGDQQQPYLTPSSPSSASASSSLSNTSPPVNIPVHERRKLVPSKKQLDKKKFQLQQLQLQQHLSGQPHHSCILHQSTSSLDGGSSYSCSNAQPSGAVGGGNAHPMPSTALHVCADGSDLSCPRFCGDSELQCSRQTSSHVPPKFESVENVEIKKEGKSDLGLLIKPKPEPPKFGNKRERKKSVGSLECDCGMHGPKIPSLEVGFDADSLVPVTPPPGQSFGSGTPGGNLQFVPGVPVQYSHLSTIRQVSGSQSAVTAALVAQQLQGVSSTSNFAPTSTSSCSAVASQSQMKQFQAKPTISSSNTTTNSQAATPNELAMQNMTSQQLLQQQQQLNDNSSSKKSKKSLLLKLDPRLETLRKCLARGDISPDLIDQSDILPSSSASTTQNLSNTIADLALDSVNPNILYQTTLAHLPVTSLPLPANSGANFSPGIQANPDTRLIEASDALADALLNEQLADTFSTPNSQVGTNQLGVPYSGIDGGNGAGVMYSNNGAAGTASSCPYPATPLLDVDSETDSNHDTALTLACAGGHEELVELLLQRGANIEHCDKKGFTPLILAATAGHAKVVEALLTHNANIEAQSERTKDTPLSLACSGGRYEVVDILLARGANKEHRNVSDYTPLSLAASGGYVNIIKLLLGHGAEINSRTGSKLGISPLMLAAMNGHTLSVKFLLEMGSDINAQIETNRNTALTLACFQGRHEVVYLLLDRKANVEHRAKTGLTPLMEAASGGYVEVGKVLIEKGADVNAPPVPSSRDTALTIAADKGHLKFVELLISKGAQTEVKNKKGNSPMWLAANGGHLEVVQALLNAKTNINSEDNRKVSCLMAAFKKGHLKLIKFMVRHVSQFPSDQELERFICTLNDEELKKKCRSCSEFIRAAKEKQAQEANKNASILLDLLEKEKTMEENRKASAQRKKQKKKLRKQEKKEEKKRLMGRDACNENDEEEVLEDEPPSAQPAPPSAAAAPPTAEVPSSSKRKLKASSAGPAASGVPAAVAERVVGGDHIATSEEKDGDSGIDSNSQTSASSEPKAAEEKENAKGKKKKKKNESSDQQKEQNNNKVALANNTASDNASNVALNNKKNSTATSSSNNTSNNYNAQEKPKKKSNAAAKSETDVPSKTVNDAVRSTANANAQSQHAASTTVAASKSKKKKEEYKPQPLSSELSNSDVNLNLYLDMKTVGSKKSYHHDCSSRVNALDTFGEVDTYMSAIATTLSSNPPSMYPNLPNLSSLKLQSPKKTQKREDGWKEVSRKSKRVSVPNHAISRVIGRGGSNINTIREVSGAHIEVEKQGKSQGDRMVIIKGSTEATRQAQNLINALVKDPDKDLSELLPKSVVKVPPKPPKSLITSAEFLSIQGSANKNLRLTTTTLFSSVTTTTLTSVYSSAKTGFSTTCAWASIASPQRTSGNPVKTTISSAPINQKSPAVRQLFTGDKKMAGIDAKTGKPCQVNISESGQSFAEKLADAKGTHNKVSYPQPVIATSEATAADRKKETKPVNRSNTSTDENSHEYSIFNNLLGQMPSLCTKEKPLSFAKAASEGLQSNKTPLGQQPQIITNPPYLDSIDTKPMVDASRAPGFRGTVGSSSTTPTLSTKNSQNVPPQNGAISSNLINDNVSNITIMTNASGNAVASGNAGSNSIIGNKGDMISSPLRSASLGKISSLVGGVATPRSGDIHSLEEVSCALEAGSSVSPGVGASSSMARSAPGTPIASPSLRPVAPVNTRSFATPPPLSRTSTDFRSVSFASMSSASSRTPPPSLSSPGVSVGGVPDNFAQTRARTSPSELSASFASAMYITPLSTTQNSLATLAPGGPVSVNQRPPDQNDFVNLAVGQPYHKVSPFSDLSNLSQSSLHQLHQQPLPQQQQFHHHHQQQQQHMQQLQHQQTLQHLQQQQQAQSQQVMQHQQVLSQQHLPQPIQPHGQGVPPPQQQQPSPLNIAALMNGLRFTAPQTNTQPVFSNNILAPISAAPPIQSTLNPNAPDFASRTPGGLATATSSSFGSRSQLAAAVAYQNGLASLAPSGFSGGVPGGSAPPPFAGGPNLEGLPLQAGLGDLMATLLPPRSSSAGGGGGGGQPSNLAFRPTGLVSHETPASVPPIGTRGAPSDQSSPTPGSGGVPAVVGVAPPPFAAPGLAGEDRHSKLLQPIGTERAQKRSERVGIVSAGPPPPPPSAGGAGGGLSVVGGNGELLWARPDILPPSGPAGPPVDPGMPGNIYYPSEMDLPTYTGPPIWNWGGADGNQ